MKKLFKWCLSPDGRKDIGAAIALVVAIYTSLRDSGVI